jgi:hypothetical protein
MLEPQKHLGVLSLVWVYVKDGSQDMSSKCDGDDSLTIYLSRFPANESRPILTVPDIQFGKIGMGNFWQTIRSDAVDVVYGQVIHISRISVQLHLHPLVQFRKWVSRSSFHNSLVGIWITDVFVCNDFEFGVEEVYPAFRVDTSGPW